MGLRKRNKREANTKATTPPSIPVLCSTTFFLETVIDFV